MKSDVKRLFSGNLAHMKLRENKVASLRRNVNLLDYKGWGSKKKS